MFRTAAVAVLAGVTLAVLARRRWLVVTVRGPSMEPTYVPGDRVLVRRAGPARLRRGQVVVFQPPGVEGAWDRQPLVAGSVTDRHWYIKRIVAAPSDPLPQEAAEAAGAAPGTPVPAGKLVLFGDGERSVDSRRWGYVPSDRVLGVVVRRLAPSSSAPG